MLRVTAIAAAGTALLVAGAAPSARQPPALRYMFNSGSAQAAAAAAGWNLLDVDSKEEADALPPRTRGLMWVGDYDNSACAWERSDAELARKTAGTTADRKVYGFLFSDEPDPYECPGAPAQHRERSRLLHRLAPGKVTVLVVDSNSAARTLAQMPLWRGAADRIALDPYPCYREKACDYRWIGAVIKAAEAARLPYWGVVQAFADDNWRWPTPAEAQRMLSLWARSNASALMTFAWRWHGNELRSRPALLSVLRRFNTRGLKGAAAPRAATQVHYTFTGPTSVAFDWSGGASSLRYRTIAGRWRTVRAHPARPQPFSPGGPFREAHLRGLRAGRTYRYAIGRGPISTFRTAPSGAFRFAVEADIGASTDYDQVKPTQAQIAAYKPAFVLVPGDLTYGNDEGLGAVDQHFNDVMTWSRSAAYMPAWGNHEWDGPGDDLRNYKGRFALPHGRASPGAPAAGCCGEDWSWFDAGPVRFISYPEPYTSATWRDWAAAADVLLAGAQRSRKVRFIVTFGHRPAYSSGSHRGDARLAEILDSFGDRYSKYVLNINGHSHNYERFTPIHGVVHLTATGGGASLGPLSSADRRTVFRALRLIHVRVDVTRTRLRINAVCGPSTSRDQLRCTEGQIVDSVTIAPR